MTTALNSKSYSGNVYVFGYGWEANKKPDLWTMRGPKNPLLHKKDVMEYSQIARRPYLFISWRIPMTDAQCLSHPKSNDEDLGNTSCAVEQILKFG